MTISLLIETPAGADAPAATTRFGGAPSAPGGRLDWPVCAACNGHMQFLGQIAPGQEAGDALLLLFMCQNDPGTCNEWEADEGGNRVIAVPATNLAFVAPPAHGEVLRPDRYGARLVEVEAGVENDGQDEDEEDEDEDDNAYDVARDAWCEANGTGGREILGQLGGEPAWIQGDEQPDCDACGEPMTFVAQLEEGPDADTAMNFGGGCAYVYRCTCGAGQPKMLWQC